MCRLFWLFVSLLFASSLGAVTFDEHTRLLPLGTEMSVYEDVQGQAHIRDILSPEIDRQFKPHQAAVLNAGYSRSVFWLRLDLHYQPLETQDARNWLLELAYPPLDHLDLYLPNRQGGYRLTQRTGDALPFDSRQIKQHSYVFSLPLRPHEPMRVYLRVESQGSIQVPLQLWSPQAYVESQPARTYVLGMIYGVLLVMLFYNLFIYLSVRDTSYLYYILYIASFGLYQLSVNGAGIEYFWPNWPWWANASTPFFIGAAALFGCQFARSFLQTRQHSPWVDRALLGLMLAGSLVMVLALSISYATALRLATYLALIFTVVIFTAGIIAWRRGLRVARYFIVAWSALLLGGIINTLMVLGYLPNLFLTMYASQIGSALEVGLLSLALADRINTMKEDRARILQDAGQKLEALNHDLAQSNQFKDEFLATITHELRTPMNGVMGSLELMKTLTLDAELAQYQKTAADSARVMMGMVNGILTLTELQAGKLYARREAFNLREVFDNLQLAYAARAEEKGLSFSLTVDDNLPEIIEGDAAKLSQAVACLLDNAVKFTRYGQINVQVGRNSLLREDLPLRIEVRDTGIGFAPNADLYERFMQVDGSMTRLYGGLGVGLSICRQLVHLLGGQLSHDSELGQGSCFCLDLPLILPPDITQPKAMRPSGAVAQRLPKQCMVLLVEDDPINQLVIRSMLGKLGYQVCTADSGPEALDILRQLPVDAIVLDCQMPVIDGFETCQILRQLPGCEHVPVLAVSTHNQQGDRERCLAVGMNDYLATPLHFEELRLMLHDWVLCRELPTRELQNS